jgi:hypothetical protein
MRCIFLIVKALKLVLVDGWRSDDNYVRVLSPGGGVLDDAFQVLFVLVQRNVLLMSWDSGIIGAEEDGLFPF